MAEKKKKQPEQQSTPVETIIFTVIILVGMLLVAGLAKLLGLDKNSTLIIEIIAFIVIALAANYFSKIAADKLR
ncbi:hypothetical protein [Schleiferilactobacillus shenzhenensis]|nr:hypothetical protein [Schleiferilactobacillus shenzhenensis]